MKEEDYNKKTVCHYCGKKPAFYLDYYDRRVCNKCICDDSNGRLCPGCGKKVPYNHMGSNGFCDKCTHK